jgi:DNA-directed RNA polymerase specialized sigma24 family protein
MATASYNEYRFANLKSLRSALRSFRTLEQMDDATSITIVLDLRKAMGDEARDPVAVLTDHQRQLIQLNLIDDIPTDRIAEDLDLSQRTVQQTIRRGLYALLAYLQDQEEKRTFLPWMFDLMRDSQLTSAEIAQRIGRTQHSVEVAMTRWRERERIPKRARRNCR